MSAEYQYYKDGNFPVPMQIFSLDLKPGEIAVYCYLLSRMDWKTRTCYPSLTTIAKAVGCTKTTAASYVKLLEEKELIYTQRSEVKTEKHGVRNGNLIYTVRPIEDAIRARIRRQEEENRKRYVQEQLQLPA